MKKLKRTKIIATIGPASESPEIMNDLINAGVNIFRFNTKHNTQQWHEEMILQAKNIAYDLNIPLGIMIDLQGPEIRVKTEGELKIAVKENEELVITSDVKKTTEHEKCKSLFVSEHEVINALNIDDLFSIDDGRLSLKVINKKHGYIVAAALNPYDLDSNKSLNLVGTDTKLPSLTEKDIKFLNTAAKTKPDYIALSFVRSKEDVEKLVDEMQKRRLKCEIISKIESQKGLENVDEIIDYSDGIMVARGDLGIETPLEKVTYFQKETIKKCRRKMKAVIIATQMLETMTNSTTPSRAEAADVSNAVYDGTDATMLSGETAVGKYPVLTAQTMSKILMFNEKHVDNLNIEPEDLDIPKQIAHAALSVSQMGGIHKIIAITATGYTARILSGFRPKVPIIAVTDSETTYGKLNINYGVFPVLSKKPVGDVFSYDKVIKELLHEKHLHHDEKIVITHGQKYGAAGKTNSLVFLEV